MTSVFLSQKVARAAGFRVDNTIYPWVAYKGPRFRPTEVADVRTDLEADLAGALEDSEWRGNGRCPSCNGHKRSGHLDDCKLSLAIKAFRGEP